MPRLWMADPTALCRKHLLGEHHETHVFLGKLRLGHRLDGYIKANHFSATDLWARHEILVAELGRRGFSHASPFPKVSEVAALAAYLPPHGPVDRGAAEAELRSRCPMCFNTESR